LAGLTLLALETGLARLPRLDDVAADAMPARAVSANAWFNIIYSSGTTGVPKGIVHDQSFRSRQADRMRNLGLKSGKIMATTTAMYSNTTLVAALGALANGAAVTLMRKFDNAGFFDIVERERVTHTMLVPVLCRRLVEDPTLAARDLGSLECTLVTSSPFSPRIKTEMAEHWPGAVWEMYGLTEGGLTTMLDVKGFPDKRATVGRPSTHAFVRVVDEAGCEVPTGMIGEVIGRSPTMMVGYHGHPDLTAGSLLRLADGEVYFRTGDLGSFDADGFLSISGRAKDVIISGGLNIHAVDLEEALTAHPAVADAAVIGVAHDVWGETPIGIVVLRVGETVEAAALIEASNRRLGRNQRLSAVHFVDELPRNALGKVTKDVLRKTFGLPRP
jgi:acyl-CoA synthetase (AMP-forming)/AMP-acid ligase II